MIARTRYFVVASLLLLGVGLGTALVAYSVGHQVNVFGRKTGPEELQYVPKDAAVVAYADVRQVMTSELRQKMHESLPHTENGQREFQEQTGINIETDIDRVVAFVSPRSADSLPAAGDKSLPQGGGLVLARGRFDEVKIEAFMREHGATIENYGGKRMIVADVHTAIRRLERHKTDQNDAPSVTPDTPVDHTDSGDRFAVAFIEPGLAAVGSAGTVRSTIDLQKTGLNITTNEDVMNQVRSLETGNAWAVGRFDALQRQAHLPPAVADRLPPITWFSVSGHVNGGLRGVIRAETRDEESANNLRDVIRGLMALAKMQMQSKPELQSTLQALELGGTGKTVALSFAIPAELFDMIGKATKPAEKANPGH